MIERKRNITVILRIGAGIVVEMMAVMERERARERGGIGREVTRAMIRGIQRGDMKKMI